MKVLNIHQRNIPAPKEKIAALFSTLATEEDKIWPKENWPKMKLKEGLQIGSGGGHGPIRYQVVDYQPVSQITFKFQKPEGFSGTHKFEITELAPNETQVKHTIQMETSGMGTVKWMVAIRWLHDALIEDAFDNMQNHFSKDKRKTEWSLWVKMLRAMLMTR